MCKIVNKYCVNQGSFVNGSELYHHRMLVNQQGGGNPDTWQPSHWGPDDDDEPWRNSDGTVNDKLQNVYDQHRHIILKQRKQEGTITTLYKCSYFERFLRRSTLRTTWADLRRQPALFQNKFFLSALFYKISRPRITGSSSLTITKAPCHSRFDI